MMGLKNWPFKTGDSLKQEVWAFVTVDCFKEVNFKTGLYNTYYFNLQAQAPNSAVIVVGTHLDEIRDNKKL